MSQLNADRKTLFFVMSKKNCNKKIIQENSSKFKQHKGIKTCVMCEANRKKRILSFQVWKTFLIKMIKNL